MAATLTNTATRLPLIVILGATGTGKSKLALEIATRFNGEIISADSMQVYRGLDIITNKVTPEEQRQAPHHLLGFLDPTARFTVTDFRNAALPIIDRLHRERKVPVVVGGTNYYIEALLWKVLVDSASDSAGGKLIYERDCEVYSAKANGANGSRHCQGGNSAGNEGNLSASEGNERGTHNTGNSKECQSGKDKESENQILSSSGTVTDPSGTVTDPTGTGRGEREGHTTTTNTSATEKKRDLSGTDRHSKRTRVNPESEKNEKRQNESEKVEESAKNQEKIENGGEKVEEKGSGGGGGGGGGGLTVWQGTEEATEVLYARLKEVDPEIAETYHPNERRKIIRSLQVWEQTGRPHSAILGEQRRQEGGGGLGGGLRYPHTLIFWLTCNQEVLLARLDARVDEMVERGLVEELTTFHSTFNAARVEEEAAAGGGRAADYTKGVFQSIGFKEFHDFLMLSEEERRGDEGRRLYRAGVDAMKLATRQYTKKQLRWIKNRFLTPSDRKVPPLYTLDATDPAQWSDAVGGPAVEVVEAVVEGRVPPLHPANADPVPDGAKRDTKARHECEVCERVLIGDHIWQAHLKGAKHRRMLKRRDAGGGGGAAGGGAGGGGS